MSAPSRSVSASSKPGRGASADRYLLPNSIPDSDGIEQQTKQNNFIQLGIMNKADPASHEPQPDDPAVLQQRRTKLISRMSANPLLSARQAANKNLDANAATKEDPPSHVSSFRVIIFYGALFGAGFPILVRQIWPTYLVPLVLMAIIGVLLIIPMKPPSGNGAIATFIRTSMTRTAGLHFLSLPHILGIQGHIAHHRLPQYTRFFLFYPLFNMLLLNLVITFVWDIELSNVNRDSVAEYTWRQAEERFPFDHVGEFFAHYTLLHPYAAVSGPLVTLFICTRLKLSKFTRDRLKAEQTELEHIDDRVAAAMQYIREKGFQAIERSSMGSITSPGFIVGLVLSFLNAFVAYIFTPDLIKFGFESYPRILSIYLTCTVLSIWPGFFLFPITMDAISSLFVEASAWLHALAHTQLQFDLCKIEDFQVWITLRKYYVSSLLPVHFKRADTALGFVFAGALALIAVIVSLFLTRGSIILRQTGPQTLFVGAILMSAYLMRFLIAATAIWDAQQQHLELLSAAQVQLRIRIAALETYQYTGEKDLESNSDPQFTQSWISSQVLQDKNLIETLIKFQQHLIDHDPAPKLLGIPIKPTLLRVIAAYLVSAAGIVGTKAIIGGG